MKFGLNDQEYQFLLVNVVRPLEQQGAKVYCYGSRARGTHRPFSDVDLMVEGGENVSGRVGEISEFVEQSNFPYKLDIVQFENFAESYKAGYQKDKKAFWDKI